MDSWRQYANLEDPALKLNNLLINASLGVDHKKTACYDIDVETDDTMKTQMNNFLLSTTSQQVCLDLFNELVAFAAASSIPLPLSSSSPFNHPH